MPFPTITALPEIPSPGDPLFASKMDTYLEALSTNRDELTAAFAYLATIGLGDYALAPWANRVMNINPGFLVSQENGDGSLTASGAFPADGWEFVQNGWSAPSSAQRVTSSESGLSRAVRISCPAETTDAADYAFLSQNIEGLRVRELGWASGNGAKATVGIIYENSVAGVKSCCLRRGDNGEVYVHALTCTGSVDFETFVVDAPSGNANFRNDTGIGLKLEIINRAGSSYLAPSADQWVTGTYIAAPNHQNSAAAETLKIHAAVLIPGEVTLTKAMMQHLVRPAEEERRICERYYEKSYASETLPGSAETAGSVGFSASGNEFDYGASCHFRVAKRVAPTVTIYNPSTGASGEVRNNTAGTDFSVSSVQLPGEGGFAGLQLGSTPTAGHAMIYHYVANARF